MGLVVKDDGWRIPDRVSARMEPLLPGRVDRPRSGLIVGGWAGVHE